ncbi:acetyltransferase [Candidatus Ferrigenium straubiae]|jgi:sugar O-acyltransferase (sialic acid O-acetyltransferase NeuD family)|uniref:acetyltransferase n=1 Tax=Candidatus Ferrigenium straubiae TaxID=2919506 RepID=UPI003F4A96DC
MGRKKEIVIVGARGFGKEVVGYIEEHGSYDIVCALDEQDNAPLLGHEVVHPQRYSYSCKNAIFAIGYPEHKQEILDKFQPLSLTWETFVHPSSIISRHAMLGAGVVVAPFSLVAGDAHVGSHVLINAFCAVAHDCSIGDRSSLMPYACVNGGVSVGRECLISTGAKVMPGITIGDRCRISAGAVVTRDIPADSLVFGNPAQFQPDVSMLAKARKRALKQEQETS